MAAPRSFRRSICSALIAGSMLLLTNAAGKAEAAVLLPKNLEDERDAMLWAKLVSSGEASWQYSYRWAQKWGHTAKQWKDRHDGKASGIWMSAVGWTVFNIHASAKNIYVSSSGNNSNDGLTTGTPKLTIAGGLAIRNSGDHVLLKRGDTFTTSGESLNTDNGIDADHPTLIGAYGTGARPIINLTLSAGAIALGFFNSGNPHLYYAITHLDLRCPERDPDNGSFATINQTMSVIGIYNASQSNGLTIEGCRFSWFKDSIELQGPSSSSVIDNAVIRRNIFEKNYGGTVGWVTGNTRAQSCFFTNCGTFNLEENIYLHSSWLEHASVNVPYDLAGRTVSGTPTTTSLDLDIGVTDLPNGYFNSSGAEITSAGETRSVSTSSHLGSGIWAFTVTSAFSAPPAGTANFLSNKRNMGRRSSESHACYLLVYTGTATSTREVMIKSSGNDKQHRDGGEIFNCHSLLAGNSSYTGAQESNAAYVSEQHYNVIQHQYDNITGFDHAGLQIKGHCLCHHNIISSGGKLGINFAKTAEIPATVSIHDNIIHLVGTYTGIEYGEGTNDATDDITIDSNKINQSHLSASGCAPYHYRPTISGAVTNVKFTNNVGYNSTASSRFGMTGYGSANYTVSAFEAALGAASNGNSFADPSGAWADPSRDIYTYYTSLGLGASPTVDDIIAVLRVQYWDGVDPTSNGANWDSRWQADAINDYVRAGFEMPTPPPSDPPETTGFLFPTATGTAIISTGAV